MSAALEPYRGRVIKIYFRADGQGAISIDRAKTADSGEISARADASPMSPGTLVVRLVVGRRIVFQDSVPDVFDPTVEVPVISVVGGRSRSAGQLIRAPLADPRMSRTRRFTVVVPADPDATLELRSLTLPRPFRVGLRSLM